MEDRENRRFSLGFIVFCGLPRGNLEPGRGSRGEETLAGAFVCPSFASKLSRPFPPSSSPQTNRLTSYSSGVSGPSTFRVGLGIKPRSGLPFPLNLLILPPRGLLSEGAAPRLGFPLRGSEGRG